MMIQTARIITGLLLTVILLTMILWKTVFGSILESGVKFDYNSPQEEVRLSSFVLDRFVTIKIVESVYTGRKFILILVWPVEDEDLKDGFIKWRYRRIADRWVEGWGCEFVERRGHYYIYLIKGGD